MVAWGGWCSEAGHARRGGMGRPRHGAGGAAVVRGYPHVTFQVGSACQIIGEKMLDGYFLPQLSLNDTFLWIGELLKMLL